METHCRGKHGWTLIKGQNRLLILIADFVGPGWTQQHMQTFCPINEDKFFAVLPPTIPTLEASALTDAILICALAHRYNYYGHRP